MTTSGTLRYTVEQPLDTLMADACHAGMGVGVEPSL